MTFTILLLVGQSDSQVNCIYDWQDFIRPEVYVNVAKAHFEGHDTDCLFAGSPNATLINLVNYALLAHEAAEEIFSTAATGQVSATLGGAGTLLSMKFGVLIHQILKMQSFLVQSRWKLGSK